MIGFLLHATFFIFLLAIGVIYFLVAKVIPAIYKWWYERAYSDINQWYAEERIKIMKKYKVDREVYIYGTPEDLKLLNKYSNKRKERNKQLGRDIYS